LWAGKVASVRPDPEPARTGEELDLLFGALADATRRGMIERLALAEATVTELAARFSISLPAISRHLKVLERALIITRNPTRDQPVAPRAIPVPQRGGLG
jgi:DNA-binding transcriptional ArsR family regulator